jgi:hypothetical protein
VVPTEAYRRWRIEQVWMNAVKIADGVVDGDLSPSTGTPEEFFACFSDALFGFGEHTTMSARAMLEFAPWIYVVRACREMLAFDPLEMMREIWREYSPDASRIIAGEPVADAETIARAHCSYLMIYRLVGLILGLGEALAARLAELDTANRVAADIDVDWPRDARKRQLAVSREALEAAGISVEEVLAHAGSIEDLARVDGLASWCIAQAQEHRRWLEQVGLPGLRAEVIPHLRPRRRRTSWDRQLVYRLALFEHCEHRWSKCVAANQGR